MSEAAFVSELLLCAEECVCEQTHTQTLAVTHLDVFGQEVPKTATLRNDA